MGSGEFLIRLPHLAAQSSAGSSVCLCVCQTDALLSCCQSLSACLPLPGGSVFFFFSDTDGKCDQKAADRFRRGDYFSKFEFLSDFSQTSHSADSLRSLLRWSSASGVLGNRSKSFPQARFYQVKDKTLTLVLWDLIYIPCTPQNFPTTALANISVAAKQASHIVMKDTTVKTF